MNITTTHRFPLRGIAICGGYFGIAVGSILFLRFLFQLGETGTPIFSRALDVVFAMVPILVGCAVVNLYPDIQVGEDGLHVQVFGFHWMFVPWRDLIEVIELTQPFLSGPLRGVVVRVHGLTLIHLLIVASQTGKITRGFVVSPIISGFDQLVAVIRRKLEDGAV